MYFHTIGIDDQELVVLHRYDIENRILSEWYAIEHFKFWSYAFNEIIYAIVLSNNENYSIGVSLDKTRIFELGECNWLVNFALNPNYAKITHYS